jgi:hypothetical protein
MLSFLGGILVGLIISLLIGLILVGVDRNNKKNKEVSKYLRRGIYSTSYTTTNDVTLKKRSFDVQFELGELESTSTKSKVFVINCIPSLSDFNSDAFREKISKMVNNTWMLSTEIEWISDLAKVRGDKLDQILGK